MKCQYIASGRPARSLGMALGVEKVIPSNGFMKASLAIVAAAPLAAVEY